MADDLLDWETEIKSFLVEALELSDVKADDIEATAPLFGGGLGLDSIDALELAVALGKRYAIKLPVDDGETRQVFASVRSLACYVSQKRGPG